MRLVTIVALIALCGCLMVLLPLSVQGASRKNAHIRIAMRAWPIIGKICYLNSQMKEVCPHFIEKGTTKIELVTANKDEEGMILLRKDSPSAHDKEYTMIGFKYIRTMSKDYVQYKILHSMGNTVLYPKITSKGCTGIYQEGEENKSCDVDSLMTFNYS
eukprot:Nk52_evm2s289 gene=Nk52_evmTU2s289